MWIKRYMPPEPSHHVCDLPENRIPAGLGIDGSTVLTPVPRGTPGDLWMCPECRGVWIIRENRFWTGYVWERLGGLMSWYARTRYAAWQALSGSTAP